MYHFKVRKQCSMKLVKTQEIYIIEYLKIRVLV